MKTYLYRASNLKSISLIWPLFHSRSQFLAPSKNCRFQRFFHNNNYHNPTLLHMGLHHVNSKFNINYYLIHINFTKKLSSPPSSSLSPH